MNIKKPAGRAGWMDFAILQGAADGFFDMLGSFFLFRFTHLFDVDERVNSNLNVGRLICLLLLVQLVASVECDWQDRNFAFFGEFESSCLELTHFMAL